MKTIIHFLKDQTGSTLEDAENVQVAESSIENMRNLFLTYSTRLNQASHLKIRPKIQRNQIWTLKNKYDDYQCLTNEALHPFLVLINKEPEQIEDEDFIRVLVISPFIEMASESDQVCDDPSIIGFPFLIETWNNQPLLTELLDEYIGYYEAKLLSNSQSQSFEDLNDSSSEFGASNVEYLSTEQQEFRDLEITRAKFINHSVLSFLHFIENKQSKDSGAVISIFGKIEYPKLYVLKTQKEPNLALAAKSGIDSEEKYLLLDSETLPFRIIIKKNQDGFVISVDSSDKMQLFTNTKEEIIGILGNDKTVFANLNGGNYTLITETIEQPIKIRLK